MVNEITRTIEVITEEINFFKARAGEAIYEIGVRLNEAKAQLQHGEWLEFLSEKVNFSEASAQRFMRIAREYKNPSTVMDLGASKALLLLALTEEEREEFIAEKHDVNGEEKTVADMSKRELEKVIKELDSEKEKAGKLEETVSSLEDEIADLRAEIKELENKPAPVAIEPGEISPEEIARIKKEAEDKLQKKIDSLNKKIEKLEADKKAAEDKVTAASEEAEKRHVKLMEDNKALLQRVDELNKKLNVAGNPKLTEFKAHFNMGRDAFNSMFQIVASNDLEKTAKEKLIETITQLLNLITESLNETQNEVYGG